MYSLLSCITTGTVGLGLMAHLQLMLVHISWFLCVCASITVVTTFYLNFCQQSSSLNSLSVEEKYSSSVLINYWLFAISLGLWFSCLFLLVNFIYKFIPFVFPSLFCGCVLFVCSRGSGGHYWNLSIPQ